MKNSIKKIVIWCLMCLSFFGTTHAATTVTIMSGGNFSSNVYGINSSSYDKGGACTVGSYSKYGNFGCASRKNGGGASTKCNCVATANSSISDLQYVNNVTITACTLEGWRFYLGGEIIEYNGNGCVTRTVNNGYGVTASGSTIPISWNNGTPSIKDKKSTGYNYAYVDAFRVNKKDIYTISYNANGGSGAPGSQTKVEGTNLTLSSTKPTRANHTFLGWSTSNTATSATYSAGGTYTANAGATLYAVWKVNGYNLNYTLNGGSCSTCTNKTLQTNLPNPIPTPTKRGYNFGGWFTNSGLTTRATPGVAITSNTTLYAKWTPITYTIEYNLNGGTGTASKQTVNYDSTITINKGNQFSKTGYVFSGWNDPTGTSWTNWSGTWTYINGQYGITGNKLVLTAQWTRSWNRYAVDCVVDSSGNIMKDSSTIGSDSAYKTQTLYFDIPVENTGNYNFCFAKSAATKTINNHNGHSSGVYYWENNDWVKK